MKLELENLIELDPTRVPLPAGTDVETRAVGVFEDRQIPLGAVGRVVGSEADKVIVDIVGVGPIEYSRADVAPRKAGQLRFALRREHTWQALSANIVVKTQVGSRAWGLADEDSDHDYRGAFVLPFPWTTGLGTTPGELQSIDGSETYWEIEKVIRQALRADPNTLEMLHLPDAGASNELGQWLLESRECFVSAEIYGSFGRYALGQLKKLRQSLRLAKHRELILAWLRAEPTLDLDVAADRLTDAAGVEGATAGAAHLRSKEYIKQLYSSLFDRGFLKTRDFAGLAEFAGQSDSASALELPRELRPKNAYNLLRLIDCATGWLRTGSPQFVVAEPLRSALLAIKRGDVELEAVVARADEMAADLEAARRGTVLPAKPDAPRADHLLSRVRVEVARRFAAGEPGPFGADGAPRPEIAWT